MNDNGMLPQNAEKRQRLIQAGYWAGGILFGLVALFALYHTLRQTSARVMRDFMSPFYSTVAGINKSRSDVKLLSQSKLRLAEAVVQLEKRNLELESQLAGARMIREENRQLRALMKLKPNPDFIPVMAEVTTRSMELWQQRFMINAGSKQGISAGDLVAAAAPDGRIAVAGRVYEVSLHTAVVATCYSDDFKLSVAVGPNQESGVLEYDQSYSFPYVRYLPINSGIMAGFFVQTSGIPRRTPGGIPLGRIVPGSNGKVVFTYEKLFSEAFVRPLIVPDSVRVVTVFTQKRGQK